MNMNHPTENDLRALLAARLDGCAFAHWCTVYPNGEVAIVDMRGFSPPGGPQLWLEGWIRGNGYTGPEAAADDGWVGMLFDWLVFAWTNGLTGLLDDLGLRVRRRAPVPAR